MSETPTSHTVTPAPQYKTNGNIIECDDFEFKAFTKMVNGGFSFLAGLYELITKKKAPKLRDVLRG